MKEDSAGYLFRDVPLGTFIKRPLVIFDLETTGVNPEEDRIVSFAAVRIGPGGDAGVPMEGVVDPGVPIPKSASDIHGITDDQVKGCPTFSDSADFIWEFVGGCDLAGFNILSFDLPMLQAEFRRARHVPLEMAGRKLYDAMAIYHQMEPRNLEAALAFYCGKEHDEAHQAMADVLATRDVIESQIARYELTQDMALLHDMSMGDRATICGRLRIDDEGRVCIGFGKHRGHPLSEVAQHSPGYLRWMLEQDFSEEVRIMVRGALRGE
jgi:DNA polymerase-3 subunit epsilon